MTAIYYVLLRVEFLLAVPIFIILFYIKAPYGKFTTSGWGPAVRAPRAWLFMELPVVILPLYFYFRNCGASPLLTAFILLWELHYMRRTFLYPLRMSKSSHRMPFLIVVFSLIFNTINGIINGFGIFILSDYGTESLISVRFILGTAIFIIGFIINIQSDQILRSLRAPGETGYKIPERGLFKWICSPHYLGEILEWTGWAILTWSPAGAAFLVFTIANLAPRAWSNLKWYRKTFPDYPKERRALIPGIF